MFTNISKSKLQNVVCVSFPLFLSLPPLVSIKPIRALPCSAQPGICNSSQPPPASQRLFSLCKSRSFTPAAAIFISRPSSPKTPLAPHAAQSHSSARIQCRSNSSSQGRFACQQEPGDRLRIMSIKKVLILPRHSSLPGHFACPSR